MTGVYLERTRTEDDVPAVFYVDNHMRPYTGKHTVRKGWRMQFSCLDQLFDRLVDHEGSNPEFM